MFFDKYKYPIVIGMVILTIATVLIKSDNEKMTTDKTPPTGGSSLAVGVSDGSTYSDEEEYYSEPEFKPIVLKGAGTKLTKSFNLFDGGYKVTSKHSGGSSNFVVYLIDEYGEELDLVANEIGTTNTSRAMSVIEGKYRFNVEADGNWTIKIEAL